jgi:hypothetical protein
MYKIGVIAPPSIYTGGHNADDQITSVRSIFTDTLQSVLQVEDTQVILDTFYPLSQCLAVIAMDNHVPVTRVSSFGVTKKEFKKMPEAFEVLQKLNNTCSGLLVSSAGKFTPKKIDSANKLIARTCDYVIIVGPHWYSGYADLCKSSICVPTALPKDIINDA